MPPVLAPVAVSLEAGLPWSAAAGLAALAAVVAGLVVAAVAVAVVRRRERAVRAEADRRVQRRVRILAEERQRVERLLDSLPVGVLLFDDGLRFANAEARDLLDLHGASARDRGDRGERGEGRPRAHDVLGSQELAAAVERAAGEGVTAETSVDLGERHLRARATQTSSGEVALVVSDLTELKRAASIRRDFVLNASHELKTPAASVQALSESLALALRRDPARADAMLGSLQREAERLGQMVRDLLDLARLEEAEATHGLEEVDLAEIARRACDRVADRAAERDLAIRCHAERPVPVKALARDVRLIATNLVDNAIAYNRPGGSVDVTVTAEPAAVVLEISDTGIGIPEAEQSRIFERFYRADKHRSRRAGGTGLGLALVRHAVQRHGGTVTLDSRPGEGTRFRVRLPSDPVR